MKGNDEKEKKQSGSRKKTLKAREELSEKCRSQKLDFRCVSVDFFCATNNLATSGQKQ